MRFVAWVNRIGPILPPPAASPPASAAAALAGLFGCLPAPAIGSHFFARDWWIISLAALCLYF